MLIGVCAVIQPGNRPICHESGVSVGRPYQINGADFNNVARPFAEVARLRAK